MKGLHPPRQYEGFFSQDMLLKMNFGLNNEAKFTQTGYDFDWTVVQKCGEQYT